MADYPLRQEADEVQEILDGALLTNKGQALSEETKAFMREKIGASAIGEGIKILSHFDTIEDLEAAVPSPSAGEAYSVGIELPYNLFIFDYLNGNWKNYGPIRANDIKARFAQNSVVGTESWEMDDTVFVDYIYKARIPLAEVTGNDFPIVSFSPTDATGGNYCPVAYAFDGYIEVWARSIPAKEVIIPAMTFIVQDTSDGLTGNSTKGISNAGGGIPTGGVSTNIIANGAITPEKIAPSARTKYYTVNIGTEWGGIIAPYVITVPVAGITSEDFPKVFFSAPDDFNNLEMHQDAFAMLYDVESAENSLTFYAKAKPEVAFAVLVEVSHI